MIEGRPRESLVQYENPIEVLIPQHACLIIQSCRSQLDKMPRTPSKRPLDVSDTLKIPIEIQQEK
jgi:hypothetical protein